MSDNNIPFEIQMEIVERIPDTKSLIRCRSVSKEWMCTIDSKKFVAAHTLRHQAANRHHLLIKTQDGEHYNNTPVKYYSIVDDDDETFPHQKVSVSVPDSVRKFRDDAVIIITSHGLFCFYEPRKDTAIIWNPSIRKTVAIPVPRKPDYFTDIAFGVCPSSLDVKLVKLTSVFVKPGVIYSTQFEVFTLSPGGTWRSPLSSNLPHKSIQFGDSPAVVDGFIYWDAVDRIEVDDGYENLIMSFDLTSEEFTKINLPDPLQLNDPYTHLPLYNLRESLVVLDSEFNTEFIRKSYHVWMMIGHGCTRSFTKLYSINPPDASIHTTLGFRKSGAPIIEVDNNERDYYRHECALAMYEPESKSITNIGIYGLCGTFFVHSYMETLLLLGQ